MDKLPAAARESLQDLQTEILRRRRLLELKDEQIRLCNFRLFGPKHDELTSAQLALLLTEVSVSAGEVEPEAQLPPEQKARPLPKAGTPRSAHPGREPLPAHLERREVLLPCAPHDCQCAQCGTPRPVIGYDTRDELVCEPAKFRARVIKREKRGTHCLPEQGVVTAPAPTQIVPKSKLASELVIEVVLQKFQQHMPVYRQLATWATGWQLPLSRRTGSAALLAVGGLLVPVMRAQAVELRSGGYVQADETPVPGQTGEKTGRNHRACIWEYSAPGGVVFDFRMSRDRAGPKEFLKEYHDRPRTLTRRLGRIFKETLSRVHPVRQASRLSLTSLGTGSSYPVLISATGRLLVTQGNEFGDTRDACPTQPSASSPAFLPAQVRLGRLLAGCLGVLLLGQSVNLAAASTAPGAELFSGSAIPSLEITIAPEDLVRLRRDGRQDVPAQVRAGSNTLERVAIHLKGSTGSFRSVDDRPALTLNFGKFIAGQRFHGLSKLHLNNSVEDPSYFNELAGAELFRAAGVPAPRVTHALVRLNGRRLGLYVLKEGLTPEFLSRHFAQVTGNLYDTGPGHDVDEALQREQGDGPDDGRDLRALAAAAREPDRARRGQALRQTLDLDRFLSFMAMEVITCHRDGYCLARNNFRLYHDPATDRLVFLPHGMDQLFGRADATIRPAMSGLVARAVMETPEGQRRYRERLAQLTTNALDVLNLHRQSDALLARLRPLLTPRESRELATALKVAKEHIAARRRSLEQQLAEPEPAPLRFNRGVARLAGWRPVDAPADGDLDQRAALDGRKSLHVRAGAMTSASWRLKVLLPPGRYQFRAEVFTRGIRPLSFGNNQGAGLRVVGAAPSPPYRLVGDNAWLKLEQTFELPAEQQVELICELRAAGGEAWFALDSLRLEQDE